MSAYDLVIRGGTVATAANTIACDTLCCTQPRPVSRNRVGFRMPAWGERSSRWVEAKDRCPTIPDRRQPRSKSKLPEQGTPVHAATRRDLVGGSVVRSERVVDQPANLLPKGHVGSRNPRIDIPNIRRQVLLYHIC